MRLPTILLALLTLNVAFAAPPPTWTPPNALVEDFNRALAALNAGNPGQAVTIAEKLAAKAPSCGMVLLLLGQAQSLANAPDAALETLQRAVKLFPDEAAVHAALAQSAFGAQQFGLAAEEGGRALDMQPDNLGIATLAVQTSLRLGDVEAARARLAKARIGAADAACLDAFVRVEANDPVGARTRLAECDGGADPQLRTVAVTAVATLGDDDTARRAMREQAAELGIASYDLVRRGEDLLNAGRYAEAVQALQAAQVALPKDLSIRVNLGIALAELGRYAEAEAALTDAVTGDTWIDVHASGHMSGITTMRTEERLRALQREAAALLVRVQALDARTGPAAATLAAARKRHGDVLELVVAEAELRFAEGKPAEGWPLLRAAAARGEANVALARGIARFGATHPEGLDPVAAGYVRAHGQTVDLLNLAVAEYNGKAWGPCLADAEAVLARDPAAAPAADIAYRCAVAGGEPDRAAPHLAALGADVDRALVHDHALALQERDRHADALALLARYPATGAEEPMLRRLALDSHLRLKQWTEAAALAARPGLEPMYLTWVGQQLLRGGRKADAARILGETCPKLAGADAEGCRALLAEAGR